MRILVRFKERGGLLFPMGPYLGFAGSLAGSHCWGPAWSPQQPPDSWSTLTESLECLEVDYPPQEATLVTDGST